MLNAFGIQDCGTENSLRQSTDNKGNEADHDGFFYTEGGRKPNRSKENNKNVGSVLIDEGGKNTLACPASFQPTDR